MLKIRNLTVSYKTENGEVKAVNKVSLTIKESQIVGLVGESGCGKSTVLFSLMGLISNSGKITEGEVLFNGKDLVKNTPEAWRKIRGKEIAMIFQDPMTTLNPAFKVGEQIRESLKIHRNYDLVGGGLFSRRKIKQKEKERVYQLMSEVGIPSPEKRYLEYPHQFSGGMQQRALIATALACEPKVLLADEPTTALDVTIQAQILDLLKKINEDHGTSIVLVTHDLGVAAEFCDEIAVMYAGEIIEYGPVDEIMEHPKHPYTQGLLRSIPQISDEEIEIEPIPGQVADLANLDSGCSFYPRCSHRHNECKKPVPILNMDNERQVRCVLYRKEEGVHEHSSNGRRSISI
ncbi:ABC transporter ATP-binding protein [Microaerobacter geothermalis]|uniref:ABC transporter ATP-binding protein n=1 Tax=Microaerobacter geothermalis TaxID=674972 RepID=UPI001F29FF1D|nr:ABC transporter ATP-binding protein [Microaerobacter geothermalis]MCF6093860.1 ABC transporter ATP-binding protein [Microaerobacter geothermalis]